MSAGATIAPWAALFSRPQGDVLADLSQFEALLTRWQVAQNLVSRETLDAFWTRHVADSLQVLPLLPVEAKRVYDLGSGGGFPALPLAVARKGAGQHFVLCESNQRKVAFLRTVIRERGLDAEVMPGRIEDLVSRETGRASFVLSRALAPLNHLLDLSFPLLAPEGRLLFHKGRENQHEIDEAGANWRFDMVRHASATDDLGVLLEIGNLARRS